MLDFTGKFSRFLEYFYSLFEFEVVAIKPRYQLIKFCHLLLHSVIFC